MAREADNFVEIRKRLDEIEAETASQIARAAKPECQSVAKYGQTECRWPQCSCEDSAAAQADVS